MRPYPRVLLGCALLLLLAGAVPCRAAWCNVFQVCCNSCGGQPSASFASPDPCCNPCPQPCMKWVQKSCYQQVTTYQQRTWCEPVTTYRTSYFWEQCTSYRYSCYWDPCTCSYQQVACPVTSYQLRSKCCPVTSYLQRCCMVPVTSMQEVRYMVAEPVCPAPCPDPCPNGNGGGVGSVAPSAPGLGQPMPGGSNPPIRVEQSGPTDNTFKPNMSYGRPPVPSSPRPQAPVAPPPSPPPAVRLDKIVVGPSRGVEGQVMKATKTPHGWAEVLFVSAEKQGVQQTVTADGAGRFTADLPPGDWLVYLKEGGNKTHFQSKVEVRGEQRQIITLTSR